MKTSIIVFIHVLIILFFTSHFCWAINSSQNERLTVRKVIKIHLKKIEINNQNKMTGLNKRIFKHVFIKNHLNKIINQDSHDFGLNNYELYPLPANNSITVHFESKRVENSEIRIYSSNFQICFSKTIDLKIGSNVIPLDLTNLVTGVYLFTINSNHKLIYGNFNVIK